MSLVSASLKCIRNMATARKAPFMSKNFKQRDRLDIDRVTQSHDHLILRLPLSRIFQFVYQRTQEGEKSDPEKYSTKWLTVFLGCDTFNHMVEQRTAALDSVFHALADSTRRSILRDITRREKTVGEIAQPYSMSLAAVSKHLDVLERASLIRRERRGSCRMVRLNPKPLQSAQDWLAFYEVFWKTSLDRLQSHLEADLEFPGKSTKKEK
jgi:DNA-binding transcriptional ArsR family regulator